MALSLWKKIALVGMVLILAVWGVQLYLYWRTDLAFEELAATSPETRTDVEAELVGFRGARVLEPEGMQPILRDKLNPDREYWRYTKYPGFAIDVVYEADGSVFSLWPEYE